MTRLLKLLREDQGANLTEYALILALVVLGSAALMNTSGSSLGSIWTTANASLNGSVSSSTGSSVNSSSAPGSGGDQSGNHGNHYGWDNH